ncbi:uncharacterized protein PV07_02107 [Cladophialophora immunda]|uniref:Uncharacterized protein n=1 Tax=Cladophialophora immunda TaxID=569365 RepID=A0A0D2DI49_9EURO|nr:uncharacterized protein PV07_02107 [Cladophialophora immunda]KIW35409.1 hypothetical protein PV07_02107 [Cladophialophora immunda]
MPANFGETGKIMERLRQPNRFILANVNLSTCRRLSAYVGDPFRTRLGRIHTENVQKVLSHCKIFISQSTPFILCLHMCGPCPDSAKSICWRATKVTFILSLRLSSTGHRCLVHEMSQIMLQEDMVARPAFLSRIFSSKGRFYRTMSPRVSVDGENSSTTLKTFISVFNSSHISRITLKDRLRQIIIQGASKAWNPSSCSISPQNLFKQDFKPADPAPHLSSHTSSLVTTPLHSVQVSLSAFLSDTATPSSTVTRSNISHISDPSSSHDEMCFKYKCDACEKARYDFCQNYLQNQEERKWCDVAVEEPWGGMLKRCHTCTTITGAIKELKALVFREPWLVTEGMAGAPEKAAWEKEGEEEEEAVGGVVVVDDDDDATPDGYTKEERDRVRREAEEAVMRRWGLMRAEQAAEGEAKAE